MTRFDSIVIAVTAVLSAGKTRGKCLKVMAMSSTLSAMQLSYVQAYEGNATQAAIQAGYSASSARQSAARLMSKAAIRAAIAARQALDSQELQIGRHEAIKGLLGAIQQAKANGEPAAMISGWREIGRMLGFYEPARAEVVVGLADESRLMANMNALSNAELVALMAGQS